MPSSIRVRIAVTLCLLIGTNVLTYAITRRITTSHVQYEARIGVNDALRRLELYNIVADHDAGNWVELAIREAGGRKAWANGAVPFYAVGFFFIAVGGLLPFVRTARPARD